MDARKGCWKLKTPICVIMIIFLIATGSAFQPTQSKIYIPYVTDGCDPMGRPVSTIDMCPIIGFQEGADTPTDQAGKMLGPMISHPLTIIKYVDKISPQLHEILRTHELLPEVKIKFYGQDPNGSGEEVPIYSVTLTNAYINGIGQLMATNGNLENRDFLENVTFAFQQIEYVWEHDNNAVQSPITALQTTSTRQKIVRSGPDFKLTTKL